MLSRTIVSDEGYLNSVRSTTYRVHCEASGNRGETLVPVVSQTMKLGTMRVMAFQGTPTVLLQLQVPLQIKLLHGTKLSLPRQKQPLHEVLIRRVP